MRSLRSLLGELVTVAVIAVGVYLTLGLGWSLIATGTLLLIGAQLYGIKDDDADLVITPGEVLDRDSPEPANEETL